jgi:hypothetical protein
MSKSRYLPVTQLSKTIADEVGKKLLEYTPDPERLEREWVWLDEVQVMPCVDKEGNDSFFPAIVCRRKGGDPSGVYIPLAALNLEYVETWLDWVNGENTKSEFADSQESSIIDLQNYENTSFSKKVH